VLHFWVKEADCSEKYIASIFRVQGKPKQETRKRKRKPEIVLEGSLMLRRNKFSLPLRCEFKPINKPTEADAKRLEYRPFPIPCENDIVFSFLVKLGHFSTKGETISFSPTLESNVFLVKVDILSRSWAPKICNRTSHL
jgi:hypothetical protein